MEIEKIEKAIVEMKYELECLNGYVHGLKMPFTRCCKCGEWASNEWYELKDGKMWCGCKE